MTFNFGEYKDWSPHGTWYSPWANGIHLMESHQLYSISPSEIKTSISPSEIKTRMSPSEIKTSISPSEIKPSISPSQIKTSISRSEIKPIISPSEIKPIISPSEIKHLFNCNITVSSRSKYDWVSDNEKTSSFLNELLRCLVNHDLYPIHGEQE